MKKIIFFKTEIPIIIFNFIHKTTRFDEVSLFLFKCLHILFLNLEVLPQKTKNHS